MNKIDEIYFPLDEIWKCISITNIGMQTQFFSKSLEII